MISGVSKILVDVDDQDKAKQFWVDKVGFDVAYDATYGDERWVEVRPPNGSPVLVLVPRGPDVEKPEARDDLMPHAGFFFTCDDVHATYEEMAARGVAFPSPPQQMHFGWWAIFEDHEGTRYAISPTSRDRT